MRRSPDRPRAASARILPEMPMAWREVQATDSEFVPEDFDEEPESPLDVPAPKPDPVPAERAVFRPRRPTDLASAGLNTAQVEGLILKTLLCVGIATGRSVASQV